MVMIFSSEWARNSLLNSGFVVTARKNRRKRIGHDWATDKRGGKRICGITIFELGLYRMELATSLYLEMSGFPTPTRWNEEIANLNKTIPLEMWLYLVINRDYWETKNTIPSPKKLRRE